MLCSLLDPLYLVFLLILFFLVFFVAKAEVSVVLSCVCSTGRRNSSNTSPSAHSQMLCYLYMFYILLFTLLYLRQNISCLSKHEVRCEVGKSLKRATIRRILSIQTTLDRWAMVENLANVYKISRQGFILSEIRSICKLPWAKVTSIDVKISSILWLYSWVISCLCLCVLNVSELSARAGCFKTSMWVC